MLSKAARLRSSRDIRWTSRRGIRVVGPGIVVHAAPSQTTGVKVALSIGRSVGNAVERHRLARQLREAARPLTESQGPAALLVVRALPEAAGRGGSEFQASARECMADALRRLDASK